MNPLSYHQQNKPGLLKAFQSSYLNMDKANKIIKRYKGRKSFPGRALKQLRRIFEADGSALTVRLVYPKFAQEIVIEFFNSQEKE